jgi:hypothetical protein
MILVPMWRGQLDKLLSAQRKYRQYLLAVACISRAAGPGADPLALVEFCRAWQLPLTAPLVGPVALLRKAGKLFGVVTPSVAALDPTGAINTGTKILARLGPLFSAIRMEGALAESLDDRVVPKTEQAPVQAILSDARTPQAVQQGAQAALTSLQSVWKETIEMARKMEDARVQVGAPEWSL